MFKKFIILIAIAVGLGFLTKSVGLNTHQAMAIAIFSASIMGTLFFWEFRLSFAFIGTSLLLATRTIDLEHVVKYSSLEVIIFLVGMMVLVGLLKENGFFTWVTHFLLNGKHMTGRRFVVVMSAVSALLSCATSEVISIIFMVAAIFEICEHLKVNPVPYVIISVLATNVGSAATVLGNPIGILIAAKSGLSFEDFIIKALPLAIVCLIATIGICMFWYRKDIRELDHNIKKLKGEVEKLSEHHAPFTRDLKISLIIFGVTLVFISLHHRLELLWNIEPNTILVIMPLFASGLVMIWKWKKAREYIERDVEWWTLLFFMFLFAQAGTLQYTGATDELARRLSAVAGNSWTFLTGMILWISTIGSSILDNVVLVAAMIPVIQSFKALDIAVQPLWWALLFGGCLGGNITLVGSTANIIALGILEKEKKMRISFMRWFGIGLTVGVITTLIVWVALLFIPIYR
jgi:Na+/H+ antiporter NhaD/arsenite permease-like protein